MARGPASARDGTPGRRRVILRPAEQCRNVPAVTLHFSTHAMDRMRHRRIRRAEVKDALQRRERGYVAAEDATATIIICSTDDGRALRVVVATDDEDHVLTVSARGEE